MLVFSHYHSVRITFLIVRFAIILESYFDKVSFEVANNQAIVTY